MTTLPSTTPLRLPRPSASTQLSLAGPTTPVGIVPAAGASQLSGADMWRVVRANLWLIVAMVVIGAAGGYGAFKYLEKNYARYTSRGSIQITAAPMDLAHNSGQTLDAGYFALEQSTHVHNMQEAALFSEVITNNIELRETPWFKKFHGDVEEIKKDIADNLVVTPVVGTKVIDVFFTAPDKHSAKVALDNIVQYYLNQQSALTQESQKTSVQDLTNRRGVLKHQVDNLQLDIPAQKARLGGRGYMGLGAGTSPAIDIEMTELIRIEIKTRQDLTAAQENLDSIQRQINNDVDPPEVTAALNANAQINEYRSEISNLEVAISQTAGAGSEHPRVQILRDELALYQQKLDNLVSQQQNQLRTDLQEAASQKVASLKTTFEAVQTRLTELRQQQSEVSTDLYRLMSSEDALNAAQAKLKACEDQIDSISALTNRAHVTTIDWNGSTGRPTEPNLASFPRIEFVMPIAILLGLGLALGIAFLREMMDTTIRSPRDISRVGNMNLLGMVPHEDDDPQSAGARLPVVIFEAPHSMMAEQLRQVRTRLQHTASLDTTRSLLVTSPGPGDGKSTIACNLASGLALNGRRILLVDANFRRPELHRVFNLANDHGFSDVLNNLDQFEHSVQETQVPNLFILPSGPKPSNATELLESQLLIDFIDRALEEFDHVIFDSGPLLFVSETVALAPRVDGVLTVVRARTNSRGVLTRMRDSLRQIKAEHLGVVLNAVRTQGGGYYGRNIRTYYEYQDGGQAA